MDHTKSNSKKPAPKQKGIEYRKADNFVSKYSNNVHIETNSWDMKLNFGELDQSIGPQVVVKHTAITLPWPYVKILSYLLQMNLLGYEGTHGRVLVPKGLITPMPAEQPKELKVSAENFAAARKLWEDFDSANPEAISNAEL